MPWSGPGFSGDVPVPGSRFFWLRAEYLLWWSKQSQFPPLVTSGPTGVIGDPTTNILLGGSDLDSSMRNGGRITIGGTALLIVVSVVLDVVKKIDAQTSIREY